MNKNELQYICLPFDQLSLQQLYDMLHLRQVVFVVEQDCPYVDADGKDPHCYHLMGYDSKGILQAYTRLVPKGISYPDYVSIGRVVVSQAVRGGGQGKILMQESLNWTHKLFPDAPLKISAQCYLLQFYTELGFQAVGEEYLEDNIPHIAMIKK